MVVAEGKVLRFYVSRLPGQRICEFQCLLDVYQFLSVFP